jgi:hypothetical protein
MAVLLDWCAFMKTDIRVCVGGGRDFTDREYLFAVLDGVHAEFRISLIIEGEQRGADTFAKEWAISHGVPFDPYEANWTKYGYRNGKMLVDGKPDLVIVFPTGGPGSNNLARQSSKMKIPFKVCVK